MIALDFTPAEEARISTAAWRVGLSPTECVKKLVEEHLPQVETLSASAADEAATAIALLESWASEEATNDPEEIREADAALNEFMQNLNRNRVESGESPLFP